jgi:hypothetical protein
MHVRAILGLQGEERYARQRNGASTTLRGKSVAVYVVKFVVGHARRYSLIRYSRQPSGGMGKQRRLTEPMPPIDSVE